jgi:hypothetical protein
MHSQILPFRAPMGYQNSMSGSAGPADDGAISPDRMDARVFAGEPLPSSPPAEVLEEIAAARRTNEELCAHGRRVRFTQDEQSGCPRVELLDDQGKMLRTLSIAEALDMAAGKPLATEV